MVDVYVVGYWSNISYIGTDKKEADRILNEKKAEFSALPWGIRTVQEAVEHAYWSGVEDERSNSEDA